MKRNLLTVFLAITFLGFVYTGITNITKTNHKLKIQDIQLKSKQSDLLELENDFNLLNKELEQKNIDAEKAKQLEQEKTQLQKQLEDAQRALQAKADRVKAEKERIAQAASNLAITQKAHASGGNCATWMAQAGIASTEATNKLILKESNCRPHAINPTSGACGIPQAYPCSKLPCPLSEAGAVCQLQWMATYVKNRYGTWDNALAVWYSRCGSPQGCWY